MIQVKLDNTEGFTSKELKSLNEALRILKFVVNSKDFRFGVIHHTYKLKDYLVTGFHMTSDNPSEVWSKIKNGNEVLKPDIDSTINVNLTIYTSNWFQRNTVGYTYPSTLRTWVNRRFFSAYTAWAIAGNLFHEWCHKIGYEHEFSYTVLRKFSVPYALGYMVEEIGKQIQSIREFYTGTDDEFLTLLENNYLADLIRGR